MNTLWLPLLLSSVIWAEEQYFLQLPNATWDEARLYCQSCFKELTTITSRNVHFIVKNLSSDYWVGLRRRYNDSIPWTAWSNGDPVTYQNWYPGHPVPNKEKKLIPICPSTTESPLSTAITATSTPMTSLATPKMSTMFQNENEEATCPILTDILDCLNMTCYDLENVMTTCNRTTVTPKTTTYNTTPEVTTFSTTFNPTTSQGATTEGTTTSNCIFEAEPDPEQYIEDACVVLHSFGMWKEDDCNKSLPYICYEERFFGHIYVSNVNTSAANLSWTEGPGAENISHYRVEITEDNNQTFNQTFIQTFNQTFNQTFIQTDLFELIQNLTAGTLYRVQVFPVKCGRDLNPQNISFYTQPSDVQNLTVVGTTNISANLNWSKPEGNRDFYSVYVKCKLNTSIHDQVVKCPSEECTIKDLAPGYEYEFTVKAVVNETFGGVPSSASDYTKPSIVRNLRSADNESSVITASWDPPEGGHSGYHYCLTEVKHNHNCSNCSSTTSSSFTTNSDITTSSSSSSTTNNNIAVCKNTTNKEITESGKSDGSKFCLCVQALTKNDTISGEMVPISAYTLPKSVTLSLIPDYQSINATWTIDGNFEKFEVMIQTAPYPKKFTESLYYNFDQLNAGVNYNISVVTINGNLRSQPTNKSDYTRPKSPKNAKANATKNTIDVKWEAPAESSDASIIYMVEYHTRFWNLSIKNITTKKEITYTNLKPGTKYEFNVRVVAGNLTSDPVPAVANTEPDKRTLVLTMLCSSKKPLHCNGTTAREDLFEKLKTNMNETFHDWVRWSLKFADRKKT